MKKLIEFVKAYPKFSAVAGALVLVSLLAIGVMVRSAWHSRSVEKQDAKIQQSTDKNAGAAAASEADADRAADSRKEAEGRTKLADEQRERARAESDKTLEPVRKARQKHEQVRKSRPADYPAMSDDELCAELAKRGIPCR